MNDIFLEEFQKKSTEILLCKAKDLGLSTGKLLESEDITNMWFKCAPDYMAAAIKEFNSYPEVALAWASYVGLAASFLWDGDWKENQKIPNLYHFLANKRGFDELDEYVTEEIMKLELKSLQHIKIENSLRSLASSILGLMKKENPEAMTENAFKIFAIATNAMFKIGASIGLHVLGYKLELASQLKN